ncbi:hypothetical protein [Prosthecobacter sp.]|uniref:hypothetical protein n=1 Tax=Prosthecobacter sp. TaxID=1965333 RepID=UPI003783E12E
MKHDPESTLRAQRWRDPPPEFLERVLSTALEESRQRPGVLQTSGALRAPEDVRKRRRTGALQDAAAPKRAPRLLAFLAFIPRPLRLPLAACWLMALFFRVTTPQAIPQSTLDSYAKLPPLTPAQLLANLKQIEKLADELLHPQHQGPQPPL